MSHSIGREIHVKLSLSDIIKGEIGRSLGWEWKRDENVFDCDDHHHALYHIGCLFDEPNRGHVWKNHLGCCRGSLPDIHYSFDGPSKKIRAALGHRAALFMAKLPGSAQLMQAALVLLA